MGDTMTAYETTLHKDDRRRHFAIRMEAGGWHVVDRSETGVLRDACYTDWHRVERARRAFAIEVTALRAEGWRETR